MITAEQLKEMRERAVAWASDRAGNIVTRERAIGEDHMALDVLDLIAELAAMRGEADLRLGAWQASAELGRALLEIGRMRRVYEIARRWCNRPLSVPRGWLANDVEMFTKLHDAAIAAEKERTP